MPMPTDLGESTFQIDGLYAALYSDAVEAAERVDPRIKHADYAAGTDAAARRILNATSPVTKAARRRLASFEAGTPQIVPVAAISFRQFPSAAAVPFLGSRVYDTAEEHDAAAWLIRVFNDDTVEVAQTRGAMLAEKRPPTE